MTACWRPGPNPRDAEAMISHPTGIVEVYVDEVGFSKIELRADLVARTETAKQVNALHCLYGIIEDGDVAYAIDMAAVDQPPSSSPVRAAEEDRLGRERLLTGALSRR